MPVLATCACGQSFELKDEFAGKLMQCPACGSEIRATSSSSARSWDAAFDRDRFLLRQKHLSIAEKYYVWDEQGRTILFVQRPSHLLRGIVAALAGVIAGFGILFVWFALFLGIQDLDAWGPVAGPIILVLGFVAALVGGVTVGVALAAKRHITFYRDDSMQESLLRIEQDNKFFLRTARFTLFDAAGKTLGHFEKNYLYDLFRKRWRFLSPDGIVRYLAKEDSIILSLLRRLLGPLFGMLRTNYIILDADERCLGEFNRKLTLLDRYVLDLSADPGRTVDRRVALALGVMLDTGERR